MIHKFGKILSLGLTLVLAWRISERADATHPLWLGLISIFILGISWWIQTKRNFWSMIPNAGAAYLYFGLRWIVMAFAVFILLGKGYLLWWELLIGYTLMLLISIIGIKNVKDFRSLDP